MARRWAYACIWLLVCRVLAEREERGELSPQFKRKLLKVLKGDSDDREAGDLIRQLIRRAQPHFLKKERGEVRTWVKIYLRRHIEFE
ncbi:hypothetical protein A3C95_00935 [Candidatus Kaiserbacteria bacterium RIFCSPHIGHO2_02_FULL_56_30]|uniref:Uncharacterized protein n=1 Tax=Candidatus Kaiserbacteria bacterium RIFCSPHIGHO2_02_FULL_56_30 TaxID=1798499 RepID=A0A1F6E1X9_9BACT|nr:MAG: hypothetical protein A3C95_00935 [Candidatus Kaiserbacteria bacterium RIFCSPHIGHO2_02_FULL_56_30]